ncbi:MAG TPA: hypothetical protein VGR84_18670 [Candidatus Acidoferrales bacterium]|nr:hypothetical protein [Candidatus Acidoferrales bacterium]
MTETLCVECGDTLRRMYGESRIVFESRQTCGIKKCLKSDKEAPLGKAGEWPEWMAEKRPFARDEIRFAPCRGMRLSRPDTDCARSMSSAATLLE